MSAASHSEVSIREATEADGASVAALVSVLSDSLDEHATVRDAAIGRYLRFAANHVLLAEHSGKVIGLLSYSLRPNLYHAADCCSIEELVIAPDMRGRGVGGRLLEEVMTIARRAGCAEVSVSVMGDNRRALEFYRRCGLDEEAILLEKHLGQP